MSDAIDVSDRTKFAMPVRNLISLLASVAVGVWAYFGIIERLNSIETNYILMQADVVKNSTFSRDWPLGRAGSLPQDSEQYMLIEFISKELTQLKHNIETGKAPYDQQQALTLEFYEKRIEGLESRMEKLKDAVAELKASNGH
ncbi:uncharacterized protein METZ01_LOCUS190883 [marine metagenome]|uniref:Fibrinogen-like coiled coil protein n=1 Tax=marine metagenome TaxID=408172 RepID=A0A382DIN7_9ZZZZ